MRIFGPGATVAQDLEPEYITVAGDRAFVTLQENNAIAEIDIESASVIAIRPLALKDHSLDGNGLDPSDRDLAPAFTAGTIAIAKWPVRGMPMPDGIDSFTVKGRTYLITANEGDARQDWPGYHGGGPGRQWPRTSSIPAVFTNAAALKANPALGRLTVSKASGDTDGDGDGFDQIHSFGTRVVTIWGTDGTQVWDSGDQIEQQVKELDDSVPLIFNSTNDAANSFDTRSDNKGPEPEGVVVGKVDGRMLAFVGLERPGGFMVFDVSDPLGTGVGCSTRPTGTSPRPIGHERLRTRGAALRPGRGLAQR